jgi:group II intron reverse transcriptase/maturase
VLDADIRGFYDTIDHGWLVKFLEHRIADKRVLRLCQKWLAAAVLEDGKMTKCEQGTPQGATVSPLLSNVYLHYVFDLWVQRWRKRQARGDVVVVRFANDVLVGFQYEWEAKQFLEELRERMRKFSLELHPDKTRLVRFGRTAKRCAKVDGARAGTFDFLGFTHICGKSRAGKFLLVRRTIRKRMQAKLKDIKRQLQLRRHQPIPEQGRWLGSVVRGFFAYHAVPTNSFRMGALRLAVSRLWRRSLRRRSQRHALTHEHLGAQVTQAEAEADSDHAPERRQNDGFDQELNHDFAAECPNGQACVDLAGALRDAHEHDVHDADADAAPIDREARDGQHLEHTAKLGLLLGERDGVEAPQHPVARRTKCSTAQRSTSTSASPKEDGSLERRASKPTARSIAGTAGSSSKLFRPKIHRKYKGREVERVSVQNVLSGSWVTDNGRSRDWVESAPKWQARGRG